MASIGPVQPGGPYLLPPPGDKKLAKTRRTSYKRAEDSVQADAAEEPLEDDFEANLLVRFPPGSGPMSWLARVIFQTYHSVLRPKLGRIVDILA